MKLVKPPSNLNEILTNMYLKPKLITGSGGMGSTFATTADTIGKPGVGKGKRHRGKNPHGQGTEDKSNGDSPDKTDGSARKKPKCFSYGGDCYINNCPDFLEFKKMKEDEKQAASTWDATTFVYHFIAIGAEGFKFTKVLLDNQANISIMRPELLSAFEKADSEVRINGVGGVQLKTDQTDKSRYEIKHT